MSAKEKKYDRYRHADTRAKNKARNLARQERMRLKAQRKRARRATRQRGVSASMATERLAANPTSEIAGGLSKGSSPRL